MLNGSPVSSMYARTTSDGCATTATTWTPRSP
jgi:hypothetical protein